jgi:ATP-binding cassette subfamily B protein
VLSDAVTNILAVKTYGREDYERGLFDEADREAMDAERISMNAMMRRGAMTSTLITIIMFVTSIFVTGGNAWFGISAGTLVMMFSFTYQLSMRFNYVNSMLARMNRAVGDAAEMTKILDEPRLVEDAPNAPDLVVTEGAIDFSHLAFRYLDAAEDDYVFRDLDLHVPAGQRVGLVGRSGSGKTTLTKLLLRLSDVQEGRILVDGQDISACTQQSLRRQGRLRAAGGTALPPVHPREHRLRQAGASDEEIREAARLANALEFIDRLPRGLDTMVGERGVKLSWWTAPARGHSPRNLGRRPHSRSRRGDLGPRQRVRGSRPRRPREPHGRAHLARRRASPEHRGIARRIVVLENGDIVEDGTHQDSARQEASTRPSGTARAARSWSQKTESRALLSKTLTMTATPRRAMIGAPSPRPRTPRSPSDPLRASLAHRRGPLPHPAPGDGGGTAQPTRVPPPCMARPQGDRRGFPRLTRREDTTCRPSSR